MSVNQNVVEAVAEVGSKAYHEIERLRNALKKANSQTEHFERHWYLRGDEIERLRAELAQARALLSDIRTQGRVSPDIAKRLIAALVKEQQR
jgi:hypothetical protein